MSEPLFDGKRAAVLIRAHLLEQLNELQQRILLIERFGEHAVPYPKIQTKLGSSISLEKLLGRHGELVSQVELLTKAIEAATEVELSELVRNLRQRGL